MSPAWKVHECKASDHDWIEQFLVEHWGDRRMILRGETVYPADYPAFACFEGKRPLGLVTYRINEEVGEVLSLDSLHEGEGIGSALLQAVIEKARVQNCNRVQLITTNDNLRALGFYQKRGFCLSAIFPGAVNESRKIKPTIPLMGENDIPIRDEIELTLYL